MTIAELVPLALKASIIASVLALGLNTAWSDVNYLLRKPSLLIRSVISMNVVMPVIATIIVLFIRPHPPIGIILVALSLAPTPPILPKKTSKAGGSASYGVSLMAISGLLAIVSVPLLIEVMQRVFAIPLHVPSSAVAKLVFLMAIAPLAVGMLIHQFAPELAAKASVWIGRLATIVLLLSVLAILATSWRHVVDQIGGGALLAIIPFCLLGLLVGHLLGGPDPSDRTVLGISTAARHPGIAMAIAAINFPDQGGVLPAILLFLLVSALCTAPYVAWRKKQGVAPPIAV